MTKEFSCSCLRCVTTTRVCTAVSTTSTATHDEGKTCVSFVVTGRERSVGKETDGMKKKKNFECVAFNNSITLEEEEKQENPAGSSSFCGL